MNVANQSIATLLIRELEMAIASAPVRQRKSLFTRTAVAGVFLFMTTTTSCSVS